MSKPVIHFEIALHDAEKGTEFYSNLFGWEYKHDEQFDYYGVEAGENGIGGGLYQVGADKFPPYVTVYVKVEDIQQYLDKAAELGGEAIMGPQEIPNVGRIGLFRDPDGNMIGLFSGLN